MMVFCTVYTIICLNKGLLGEFCLVRLNADLRYTENTGLVCK